MRSLEINQLTLWAYLGHTEKERSDLQEIRVSLKIVFSDIPRAESSDKLEDSICYAELTEHLNQVTLQKKYGMIEHLAQSMFEALKKSLCSNVDLSLTLHKITPPIGRFCVNDISYTISD